jgi:hypothetical protein
VLNRFKGFIESLTTRLRQRLGVEVGRHADAVCVQKRARRSLEPFDLASELESRGAKELATECCPQVRAGDTLRPPCLDAEVSQLLLPAADGALPPATAGAVSSLPLSLSARRPRKPCPPAQAEEDVKNDTPLPTPAEGKG